MIRKRKDQLGMKIMKAGIFLLTFSSLSQGAFSQKKYEPTWKSLDTREIPTWYTDAKFGIFIHWGPYSVPAFSKIGAYSEWYWMNLVNPERVKQGYQETNEFHKRVYGENFTYPDFVPLFTADMYDPAQWARIFEKSGVKYVVLTSKHHDGYTLWPSVESDRSWGRPWSSTNSGPGRDLLGELTTEVKKTDLKMGIYYSLYEWFNPLYTADVNLYVEKHMMPQIKDVMEKYKPVLLFSDGEWDHPHTTWKSTDFLAWLYNESSVKEEVVVNDRWGKKTRHQHGSYYTTEYGSGLPNADNPWEENRGMAHSFGYSKTENIEDYNSSQELLYMLIDIVSRGGNFLLDIGPTADGRIPVIMQERLLDIGKWLEVNGEAIYGTTVWKESCQWTKGIIADAKRGTYKVKYDVMKLTVAPDPGFATKEIFFTRKGNELYSICPVYPKKQLRIKNISLKSSAKVEMLGDEKSLKWKREGEDVVIEVPALTPSEAPCQYAWVFKLSGIN